MGATLRRVTLEDVDALRRIETASYPEPWDDGAFRAFLGQSSTICLAALHEADLIGYALGSVTMAMSQLLSVAVLPERRDNNIGRHLVERLVVDCQAAGATHMRLEVRSTNRSARHLYTTLGFTIIGLRAHYYGDDDALIMQLDF